MKYIVAQPDLISNSYFPALAAVELGFFNEEGIDAEISLHDVFACEAFCSADDRVAVRR